MNQSIDLKSFVSDIYDGEYADLALQGLEKLISDHRDRLSEAAGRFAGSGSSDQGGSRRRRKPAASGPERRLRHHLRGQLPSG
jgi:hypothetical protein